MVSSGSETKRPTNNGMIMQKNVVKPPFFAQKTNLCLFFCGEAFSDESELTL
jgi:hypothetical protein